MEYKLIRSKRKSLTIKITPMCEVVVLAPKKCSLDYINNFIIDKQKWIIEKLKQQQINKCAYDKYISLQDVLIFGQSNVIEDYNNHYQIGEYYIKHTNASNKKKVIKDFLIKLANAYIPKRVEQIAGNLSLNYNSIQIISARKSWGSCNNLKQLKFNFRLTMIPKELIDYVICHELCHIKELNHSKRFWELLANLGYKKTAVKQAFKDYGFVLQLF